MVGGDRIGCYVPLDALLDTRIGVIDQVAGEVGLGLVESWYHTRTADRFDRKGTALTQAAYQAAWAARSEETLKRTRMTFVPMYLMNLISRFNTSHGMPIMAATYNITVNTYPYRLSDERKEQLQKIIETYTSGIAEITIDYISPADLTVEYVKANYSVCIMYEFDEWLMLHKDEFSQTQMPGTVILAPKLYLADVGEDVIKRAEQTDGFAGLSLALCALVTVVFLDVRLFSYVTDTPPNLDE
ncbi:hypothetical protein RAY_156 [Erwinia phage vB_EamM_RAY]|uniref:Uncharacterized protein n=1 Tax=Erwinia phage vB_EamM_RAY TaxID=1815987 RepID=A0A173GE77_9CAUD|nr:hypothetical protein FDH98_gp156 [Erwinia phage vB_EamM_RAY]ANH51937.1 hypothetical protein RAY_156 [Erwinia phage vB_EamM_RAY]